MRFFHVCQRQPLTPIGSVLTSLSAAKYPAGIVSQGLPRTTGHCCFSLHSQLRVSMATQAIEASLSQSATFLVLSLTDAPGAIRTVKSTLAAVSDITKNVSIRHQDANLSCTVGIGSNLWNQVTKLPRPAELHPFREIKGARHTAVSTPGDLLFHIRSERRDLSFEFERQVLDRFGDAVRVEDETLGFRYFDTRDVLGFVDGTANPVGPEVTGSVLVTAEDDIAGKGGSYVVVQKYLHDLQTWRNLKTEEQEAIIGRTKIDNIELDDAESGQQSHKTLATIENEDGSEDQILRDNMPFGSPAQREFGTYFIGYSRKLHVIERMMERMFVGNPPGLHDRILDFSTPVTGSTFFVPPAVVLNGLGD